MEEDEYGRAVRFLRTLLLLESWVQNELQQQPDQILTLMESTIHQGAVGAAWQNLPLQTC